MSAKHTQAVELDVGDLIFAEEEYWEVIQAAKDDEHQLFPEVAIEGAKFTLNGKTLSYAVLGLRRRDYHEILPCDIVKAWTAIAN